MTGAPHIIVLLPFEPDGRREHDALLAAAADLRAATPESALHVLQLTPSAALAFPRAPAGTGGLQWWSAVCPGLSDDARVATLVGLFREALPALGTAASRRLVLLPAGPAGEELAATLAWDCAGETLGRCQRLAIEPDGFAGERPACGGRAVMTLRTSARLCFATLRRRGTAAAAPEALPQDSVRTVPLTTPVLPEPDARRLDDPDAAARLEGALIVVSGGRGMQGPDGFAWLGRIAASLEGAVGGSLPTVDAGWVPVSRQIGQSGKYVSPRLYFAVGISGTPQHMAGIAAETAIVALNSDPEAPIFGMARTGVAGDWRDILPLVAQRLAQRPGRE